ncbi:MAG: tetratricopeptide repeat protein, partial [Holophagales bacterium]|nr:tetratricopeptide repeat protein [Holophagales bacterium]
RSTLEASVPTRASAHRVLGSVALKRGEPTTAREALDQAVALEPSSPVGHYQLSQAHARLGDRQLSERHRRLYLEAKAALEAEVLSLREALGLPADGEPGAPSSTDRASLVESSSGPDGESR